MKSMMNIKSLQVALIVLAMTIGLLQPTFNGISLFSCILLALVGAIGYHFRTPSTANRN